MALWIQYAMFCAMVLVHERVDDECYLKIARILFIVMRFALIFQRPFRTMHLSSATKTFMDMFYIWRCFVEESDE